MAHLNWKYAQNMFLRATDGRRPQMLRIGADHVAKLTAKLGSPPDPDVQVCLNRVQPLFDAFQLAMVVFDVRSGTRKGQTEVLVDLLKELTAVRVPQWDITVQGTFIAGTPEYTQIFPNGRGPFQSGQQDSRILAVHTLGQRLAEQDVFGAASGLESGNHRCVQRQTHRCLLRAELRRFRDRFRPRFRYSHARVEGHFRRALEVVSSHLHQANGRVTHDERRSAQRLWLSLKHQEQHSGCT